VCATGYGIRRSKDLRARFRKFLDLTNERKNMSTKTLRKRIALVAVSALGAGLLSVVAAPSANAAAGDTTVDSLQISTTASSTGEGAANQTVASQTSSGWVTQTSTSGTSNGGGLRLSGGASGTGIVLAGAKLAVSVAGNTTSATGVSLVVTGGTLSSVTRDNPDGTTLGTSPAVNGSATAAVVTQAGTTVARMAARFNVSAAAGTTATIAAYSGTGITGTTTATNGTLLGIWTLTVATASASGVYAPTYSSIYTQTAITKGTTAGGAAGTFVGTYDVTDRIANGKAGVIVYQLADAYAAAVTSGTLSATATNNATIKIVDTGAEAIAGVYSASTSFSTLALSGSAYNGYIVVNQPASGVAGSTTVTITLDGSVLATKTLNWNGDVASLAVDTVNSNSNFKNGADLSFAGGLAGIIYVAKDAAGNTVDLAAAPTVTSQTGSLVGASLAAITGTTNGAIQDAITGYGYGTMTVPSSTLSGAGTYKLKVTNGAGTTITSQEVKAVVSASSGLDSFTATWDKATYAPGEIAVLTVTGKDTLGNVIADGTAAAGLSLTVAGSATAGLYAVGTACTTATAFYGGKFTCKFAANTEGAWSYSVDVTTNVNAQSPTVGSLKVTAGSAVSNADVLKAIVSLIASINKQIAALQKALLKK
jgi:hypothetical protein